MIWTSHDSRARSQFLPGIARPISVDVIRDGTHQTNSARYRSCMNMKRLTLLIGLALICGCSNKREIASEHLTRPPSFMIGRFVDDYGINYSISENEWLMEPDQRFRILEWNVVEQYALAKNHSDNVSDANCYSRIDFILLDDDSDPYSWGFCFSTFNAESLSKARATVIADRKNPKTGCNGYPFSRMKERSNEQEE